MHVTNVQFQLNLKNKSPIIQSAYFLNAMKLNHVLEAKKVRVMRSNNFGPDCIQGSVYAKVVTFKRKMPLQSLRNSEKALT